MAHAITMPPFPHSLPLPILKMMGHLQMIIDLH